MAVSFANDPTAKGFFAPTRFESDVYDCEVSGTIPADLAGSFYRIGAEWFYPPKFKDDSPFNADGLVSMFRFANGSCDYKGRWVKTERFLADKKARRQLYGYYRNRSTDDPSVQKLDRGVANTHMIVHAGKLFALKEDSPPMEIDPHTLDTKGYYSYGGQYKSPTFTAHPKLDMQTGELITYGYEAKGDASNEIYFAFIDKAGKVRRELRFPAPYVSMVHDIAISEKHIVIPVYGMVTSKERLAAGKIHWGWDSSLPTYFGIFPRDGEAKDVRWFKGPERAIIHTFSARTIGNKVILDAPISDSNPFPFFPNVDGAPFNPAKSRTVIRRLTFDLGSKHDGWKEQILYPNAAGSLSRIDDRFIGHAYRYGFMSYNDASRPFDEVRGGTLRGRVSNCIGRFDFQTGTVKSFFAGDTHSLQEVVFAPRKPDSPEGDGYLLAVCSNYAAMRSEVVIVDAQNPEAGELARVIMPFRAPGQIHGWWSPAADFGTGPA